MRDFLKKNLTEKDYWVYGLSENDFDSTVELTHTYIDAIELRREKIKDEIYSNNDHDTADDIWDDIAYYTWTESQFLWHFCLWRVQAIFESLIVYTFIPNQGGSTLVGLKSKLDKMLNIGYTLEQDKYEELLLWSNLRNALSHAPPEEFRPGPLSEEDCIEYIELVKEICKFWRTEMPSKDK